jgi:hypothetical protein
MHNKNNFRKTIKRGGFNFEQISVCPKTPTGKKMAVKSCAKKFADDNNFIIVKTVDDGNCFYDTLSIYGKRKGIDIINKHHLEIRKFVTDEMLRNLSDLQPFFVDENGNFLTKKEVIAEIKILGKDGVWDRNGGDIVIQYAAKALNITIEVYDVHEQDPDNIINKLSFTVTDSDIIVKMLRVDDSHYQLLWPENEPQLPKGRRRITVKKNESHIEESIGAKKENINNKSLKHSKSLEEDLKKIAKMEALNKNNKNKSLMPTSSLEEALQKIALFESSIIVPK